MLHLRQIVRLPRTPVFRKSIPELYSALKTMHTCRTFSGKVASKAPSRALTSYASRRKSRHNFPAA